MQKLHVDIDSGALATDYEKVAKIEHLSGAIYALQFVLMTFQL